MRIHPRSSVQHQSWLAAGSAAVIAAFAASHAAAAGAQSNVTGIWFDDTGKGAIQIEQCGSKLCGRIVWLKDPLNDQGVPKLDRYNPDQSKRTRPVCGLPIIGNVQPVPGGGFDNGWIYDPKTGNSYSVAVDPVGVNQLQVTGYQGIRLMGKVFVWTRAPADLPLCDAKASEGAKPLNPGEAAKPLKQGEVAKPAVNTPPLAARKNGNEASKNEASKVGGPEILPWAVKAKPVTGSAVKKPSTAPKTPEKTDGGAKANSAAPSKTVTAPSTGAAKPTLPRPAAETAGQ